MNTFIQVCDIISAIVIILALNMVAKNYRWWLFYAITNITFITVTVYKGLPGLAIMGIFLGITGIRNYFIGRKKESIQNAEDSISE